MFDSEFYPTPRNVIDMMLSMEEISGKRILEPSAGKGDIVDYLNDNHAVVYACERHPELATIVQSKATFLKHDFFELKSNEVSHIEMIVINPPFSNADKHILHAWTIAPDGCRIIALCNMNTINNTFSRSRNELSGIIQDYGRSINMNDCFSEAERKTGCNIAMVVLDKPKENQEEFDGYFDTEEEVEEQSNGIMPYNEIREIVNRYVAAVKMYDSVKELSNKINSLTKEFSSSIGFGCYKRDDNGRHVTIDRETYKKSLQKDAWLHIFDRLNMEKYLTNKMKEDINKFVEQQTQVPFTMKNVYKMIQMVIGTHKSRMDKAAEDVFDLITKHYHENRYHLEGWKTNDSYIVNKKIILPYMVQESWTGKLTIHYNGNKEHVEDLCKVLYYLTGTSYDNHQSLHTWSLGIAKPLEWYLTDPDCIAKYTNEYEKRTKNHLTKMTLQQWIEYSANVDYSRKDKSDIPQFGQWYDWGFFRIKAFKKGTMHFEFKDKKVWETFNRKVADIKGNVLPHKI